MPRGKRQDQEGNLADLMQALLITELGRAGVGQMEIRKIVGCGMNRVSQIVKQVERERKRLGKGQAVAAARIEKKLDTIIHLSRKLGRS